MVAIHLAKSHCLPSLLYSCEILHDTHSEDMRSANVVWNNAFRKMFNSFWREIIRGGFRHVQHVRPNSGPTKRDPHKRTGKFFLQHSNMPKIINCSSNGKCGLLPQHYGHRMRRRCNHLTLLSLIFKPAALCWWAQKIIRRKRFCVARWRHKVSSQVLPAGIDNYLLAQRLAHVIL